MKTKKEATISNRIADSIRDEINYGKLTPNSKVLERDIAEKYEASHIPVREALRILEGEGLLVHRKFAGYMVREVTPDEMIELYNIMKFVTVQLLSRAIPRYTEMTYYQLKFIIAEMGKNQDADKNIDLLKQFADAIFFPAGLIFTYDLSKQILRRNIPTIQGLLRARSNGSVPVAGFNHFVDLCEKHEIKGAVQYASDQLDILTKSIVAYMSESLRK
jgi:DNA-binding GntR family transcriptional regulator